MTARLDGNALAGPLSDVFGRDMTAVVGRCRNCGDASELARTRVYPDAPGIVVRCPGCTEVLFTLVRARGRTLIGFGTIAGLQA